MNCQELLDTARASLHLSQGKLAEQDWSLALDYAYAAVCAIQSLHNHSRGLKPELVTYDDILALRDELLHRMNNKNPIPK